MYRKQFNSTNLTGEIYDNRNGACYVALGPLDTIGIVKLTPQSGADSLAGQPIVVTPRNPFVGQLSGPILVEVPVTSGASSSPLAVGTAADPAWVLDLYFYSFIPQQPVKRNDYNDVQIIGASGTVYVPTYGRRKVQVVVGKASGAPSVTISSYRRVGTLSGPDTAFEHATAVAVAAGTPGKWYEFGTDTAVPQVSVCDYVTVVETTGAGTLNLGVHCED